MAELSTEARELDLYAENTAELYGQFKSIIGNLTKRIDRGTYDAALAPKLWRYWYDAAARGYAREHGWHARPEVRQECADARAVEEFEKITDGEYVPIA